MRLVVWAILGCFLISCKENESIVGTWDLIKSKDGGGSEMIITPDFEYSIRFTNDEKYQDFTNGKSFSGMYSVNKNSILEMINPKTKDTLYYLYQIENATLTLNKTDKLGNLICRDGCKEQFKRVND